MEKYVINGGKKLYGSVRIESAKNAVLPILAACILTEDEVVIHNVPKISDVLNMIKILKSLGVKVAFVGDDLLVNAKTLNSYSVPNELTATMRSSIFLLGPLLARVNKVNLSYPGGCDIGIRPIDIHLYSLMQLGVIINELGEQIICSVEKKKSGEIYLDFPSVGATENLLMYSVLSQGTTVIHNPAREPEIADLINFLNKMGAKISIIGNQSIVIEGVKKLNGTDYTPIPDRIEAGTYILATAMVGGKVEIHNGNIENISSLVHKICDNTCKVTTSNGIINVESNGGGKSFSFETGPYPFFPTDLQAPTMALLTLRSGTSVVCENVFEMRFHHVPELVKMGADITIRDRTAIVRGVKELHGASVKVKDLRGGAALCLAGISAKGRTVINDIKYIERGYYLFDQKLRALGVDIKKK